MKNVMIQGVEMSVAAAQNVEETGADVAADVAAIRHEIERSGAEHARANLRAFCLEGSADDRREGWEDYVSAVMAAAS